MQAAFDAAMPQDSALPVVDQTIRFSETEFKDDNFNADDARINAAVWQLMPLPLRAEHVPLKANPSIAGTLLPDDAPPILQRSDSAPQFSAGVMPQRETIQQSITATAPQAALRPQYRVAGSKLREPEVAPMAAAEMRAEAKPAIRAGINATRTPSTESPAAIVDDAIPLQAASPRIALTPQQHAAGSKQLAPAAHSSAAGQTIAAASIQIQPRGLPVEPAQQAKAEQTTATSEHSISASPANMPQPLSDVLQAAIDIPHKEKLPQQAVSDAPPQLIQQPLPQRAPSAAPDAAPQTAPKNTPQQASAAMVAAPAPASASAANGGSTLTYRFDKWNGNHTVTVQAPTKADTPQYILAPSDSVVSQRLSEHLAQSQQMADVPPMRLSGDDERQQQRQQTPQEDDEDEA
jgi:hypothetical protein